MKCLKNEPLKKHTSFRIGGPAAYFLQPKNMEELIEALKFAKERKLMYSVMGAGSNLLVLDKGFPGLVIKIAGGFNDIKIRGRTVKVGAGVLLPRLINYLARKGLGGLEFLAGIPGTVGGAVVMNAGAWGKEIGDFVQSVKVLDNKGKVQIIEGRKMQMGYRRSIFHKAKLIIFEMVLKLRKSRSKMVRNRISEFLRQRRMSQPLGIPNAGCVFKNPKGRFAGKPCLPAGKLIEEAGCKEMRVGDAQVSAKHANFIVNLGDAKARDVLKLLTRVQRMVKERFKVQLEPELKIMIKSQ